MTDLDLRVLERATASGDENAKRRLFFKRRASKLCVDCGLPVRKQAWHDIVPPITCGPCRLTEILREKSPEEIERFRRFREKHGLP